MSDSWISCFPELIYKEIESANDDAVMQSAKKHPAIGSNISFIPPGAGVAITCVPQDRASKTTLGNSRVPYLYQ